VIGFVDSDIDEFHENLNTLEFCQKFANTVEIVHSNGIVKQYQD